MSILDKASLIQIPSGYKSGTLYSIKPNSTDGDFDFSRSSSATRVNSEGLIETAQIIGSELVTNGDFASDTWWLKSSANVNISNGKGNFTAGTTEYFYKTNLLTAGKTYKIVFEITDYTTGYISCFGGSFGAAAVGVGTYIRYYTSINTTFGLVGNTFIGSIDNVSVKEVIENDVPRLDYSDGSCPSLLLEGQSTNLITYSEDIGSNGFNPINSSIVADQTTSPDGTTNADLLRENTANDTHFMFKDFNLNNGQTYSVSVFAKKNGSNRNLRLNDGGVGWSSGFTVNFDLTNGTADNGGVIENYGNGWYRCSVVGTTNATTSRLLIYSILNSTTSYQGDGSSGVYLYGLQIEQGSYPTSYIPSNSGSATTRVADVCNNAGTSATFNDSEGVLFFEAAALADDLTNRGFALSDGTSNNACRIYYANSSNNIRFLFNVGGAAQVIKSINLTDITDYNKIAFSYKANDFKIYINGVKVAEDTSGSVPSANTFNKLSFDRGYGGENFYGKVKQLMTFNEALSNEELSDLTGQINTSFVQLANFYNYTIL